MTRRMGELQAALPTNAPVKLISLTTDPEHDTPQVLDEYSKTYKASAGVWHFLTGEKERLNHLSKDVFKLGLVDGSKEHSTRFVLVDKLGRIRGYYGIAEGNPVDRIAKDAARLEKEPA